MTIREFIDRKIAERLHIEELAKPVKHHGRRSPNGKREKVAVFGVRLTPEQRHKVMRHGGGLWLRKLIEEADE